MPFIAHVADGRREHLNIFGNDYKIADGTVARDYIHDVDSALAHTNALNQNKLDKFEVLNIGEGKDINVFELLNIFQETCGVTIKFKYLPSRDGYQKEI
jgi:UDP-glucose 4-epimerase